MLSADVQLTSDNFDVSHHINFNINSNLKFSYFPRFLFYLLAWVEKKSKVYIKNASFFV